MVRVGVKCCRINSGLRKAKGCWMRIHDSCIPQAKQQNLCHFFSSTTKMPASGSVEAKPQTVHLRTRRQVKAWAGATRGLNQHSRLTEVHCRAGGLRPCPDFHVVQARKGLGCCSSGALSACVPNAHIPRVAIGRSARRRGVHFQN